MKVKKTKTQSKKKPFSTKDMPIVKLKKGTREEQCSPTQKLREITIPTKKIKSTKTASNSSFKVGEKVEKQIFPTCLPEL
jgi:hypothetical protein